MILLLLGERAGVKFLPTQARALYPRTVAADVRRRKLVICSALRLLTAAATNERFMVRAGVSFH